MTARTYASFLTGNMLISSQNRDDYLKAHEIIDAQEALAKCISEINDFLNEIGADNFDSLVNAEAEKDVAGFDFHFPDIFMRIAIPDLLAVNDIAADAVQIAFDPARLKIGLDD